MKFLNIYNRQEEIKVKAGSLLVAEPFLQDPNFARTVVFVCEHSEEGSVGFVLNRPTDIRLNEVLPNMYNRPVLLNQGGPVELDTLHMLHSMPDLLGGNEIAPGLYWGGSYDALQSVITDDKYPEADLKLFLGYSGWTAGQIDKEMGEGSWLVAEPSKNIIFGTDPKMAWRDAIYSLGKNYELLANMPLHPQLN
jgi:putative transcriptional regulator